MNSKEVTMDFDEQHCLGAYEARTHFSDVLDRVEHNGESFAITRHGRRVARLVPEPAEEPLCLKDWIMNGPPLDGVDLERDRGPGRRHEVDFGTPAEVEPEVELEVNP
jgi:prevent-host-death family protein